MLGIADENSENWPQLLVHEAGRRWIDGVRNRLARLPVRVRHSAVARDSLEIARHERRCMVLAELGLRPLDTLELLAGIDRLGRELTVIVVARSDQADLEIPARELGAAVFLTEPLTVAELVDLVEPIVRSQFGWERKTSS